MPVTVVVFPHAKRGPIKKKKKKKIIYINKGYNASFYIMKYGLQSILLVSSVPPTELSPHPQIG